MIAAILLVAGIAAGVVAVASKKNIIATAVTVVGGAFGIALAVGLICDTLAIPRHEWQAPIIFFAPLVALGLIAAYTDRELMKPITFTSVQWAFSFTFADYRRRSSVRADVRRQVKQYRVEVS